MLRVGERFNHHGSPREHNNWQFVCSNAYASNDFPLSVWEFASEDREAHD